MFNFFYCNSKYNFKLIFYTIFFILLFNKTSFSDLASFTNRIQHLDPLVLKSILEKADIIIFEKTEKTMPENVVSAVLLDAPIEKVWSAVTDYANYTKIIPNLDELNVLKREGNTADIHQKFRFNFSVISKKINLYYKNTYNKPNEIDAILYDGDIDKSEFHWRLIPIDNSERTILLYSNFANVKSLGKMIKWVFEEQPVSYLGLNASTPALAIKAMKEWIQPAQKKQFKENLDFLKHIQTIDKDAILILLQECDIILFEKDVKIPDIGVAGAIFDANPERVFSIIKPKSDAPQIYPNTTINVIESDANSAIVEETIKFKFSIFSMSVKFKSKEIYDKPHVIDSTLIEGELDKAETHWKFEPIENGEKTLAYLLQYSNYRSLNWLANWVFKQQPELGTSLAASTPIISVNSVKNYIKTTKSN